MRSRIKDDACVPQDQEAMDVDWCDDELEEGNGICMDEEEESIAGLLGVCRCHHLCLPGSVST